MLIGVTVSLWTAKNVTSWHLPFWERDPLRKNDNYETVTVTNRCLVLVRFDSSRHKRSRKHAEHGNQISLLGATPLTRDFSPVLQHAPRPRQHKRRAARAAGLPPMARSC